MLRLKNSQNARRAADPERYPRNATIAYSLDEMELESKTVEAAKIGFSSRPFIIRIRIMRAYFSSEGRRRRHPFGEPTYPDAWQIVVSVYNRVVAHIKGFAWSDDEKDFVEVPIRRI